MRFLSIIFLLMAPWMSTQAQSSILGTWANEENKAHVTITSQAESLNGHIAWLAEEKAQAKIGTKVFIGLTPKGDEWKGKVYSAKRDEIFPATFSLQENRDTMKVVVNAGFLTQTQIWTRVKT
ncbi:MAG: DUF2147 domain-containing protein [Bacteroidota bacterium]